MLLYCLGKGAEDVLASTNITEEERKVYQSIITKLNEFFKVRQKCNFEFNSHVQQAGESGEEYITALYGLIKMCEYDGAHKEELLRDSLVVGIRDQKLSQLLQMNAMQHEARSCSIAHEHHSAISILHRWQMHLHEQF